MSPLYADLSALKSGYCEANPQQVATLTSSTTLPLYSDRETFLEPSSRVISWSQRLPSPSLQGDITSPSRAVGSRDSNPRGRRGFTPVRRTVTSSGCQTFLIYKEPSGAEIFLYYNISAQKMCLYSMVQLRELVQLNNLNSEPKKFYTAMIKQLTCSQQHLVETINILFCYAVLQLTLFTEDLLIKVVLFYSLSQLQTHPHHSVTLLTSGKNL